MVLVPFYHGLEGDSIGGDPSVRLESNIPGALERAPEEGKARPRNMVAERSLSFVRCAIATLLRFSNLGRYAA